MFTEYYTLQVLRYLDMFFFNDCRARWICPYAYGVFAFIHLRTEWTLWCVCWIMNDCTGEINLPLRLRCVRFYTFTHWMNLVVCLLDYEWLSGEINLPLRLRCVRWYYAMNEPCGVFVGLWMIVVRDESAPTSTVCSLLYIYAMNRPVECPLIYILSNK